jgi:hypothetical protein
MKKILHLTIVFFLVSSFTIAGEKPTLQINTSKKLTNPAPMYSKKIEEGGFYLHFGALLPTKNFYCPKGVVNKTSERFSLGGGIEIGELFQLIESRSKASFGLRFTFLNALYNTYSDSGKTIVKVLQGSAFDLGPCFTVGFDEHNAIDMFYQLCPTYMFNPEDTADYTNSGSFGLVHTFGIGYRYNLLSIGATFNLGNVKYIDATTNDKFMKHRMDYFRFYIGMMF